MSTQLESGFINSTIGQHRGYQFLVLCIFIVVGVVYFSHPAQALEPLTKNQMSQVNGKAGVKLQANLRINVSSDFHNAAEINREPQFKNGRIEIAAGNSNFLVLDELFGTVNAGISMDISPGNYLQIEMTELSGVNLTIDEIRLDPGPGPDGGDGTMLGSLTIAGNDPDGDKSLIDGTGNFNFHNTKLKVFGRR